MRWFSMISLNPFTQVNDSNDIFDVEVKDIYQATGLNPFTQVNDSNQY